MIVTSDRTCYNKIEVCMINDRKLENIFEQIKNTGNYQLVMTLSYEIRAKLFNESISSLKQLIDVYKLDDTNVFKNWFNDDEVINFIDTFFANGNDYILKTLVENFGTSKEMLIKMLGVNGLALAWVKKDDQDRELGLVAVNNNISSYKLLRDDLKLDVEIAKALIKSGRLQVSFLPKKLCDVREVIEFYIRTWDGGLHVASPRLCDDKELVLLALNNVPKDIFYVSNRLRGDVDVIKLLVEKDYRLIRYANGDVLNNYEILSIAFNKMLIAQTNLSNIQITNLTKLFNRFYNGLFISEPLEQLNFFLDTKILKLASLEESLFDEFLSLFNYEKTLKMNNQVIDSVSEAIIQREFKYQNSNLFKWFIEITNLIKNNQKEEVIKELVVIKDKVNIDDLLKKHSITFEMFIYNLLHGYRDNSKDILHDIYLVYLDYERNNYLKKRQKTIKSELDLVKRYDKKYLLKSLWNLDESEIINLIYSINSSELDTSLQEFLDNRDLVVKCVKQRKNPNLNLGVNKSLYLLNRLIDKLYFDNKLDYLVSDDSFVNFDYESRDVSNRTLFNVIRNIDYDHFIDEVIKNNKENGVDLYEELKKILSKFRLLGWGDTFNSSFKKNGMEVDSSTFVAFFNYFSKIYPKLYQELQNGRIKNINLARILDEILLYSSVPSKVKDLVNEDDYNLIYLNPELNAANATKDYRLRRVPDLVKAMYERKYVTVPSMDEVISFNDKKCRITIGNVVDSINLTLGERTGSCARIGGLGENLFEFCLLNENGFHMVFRDPYDGSFVSKASCFRNGNTVFINMVEISQSACYSWSDLQKVTTIVAQRIIDNTKDSEYPIENVLVSNKQAFDTYPIHKIIKLDDFDILEGLKKIKIDITPSHLICLNNDGIKDIKLSPYNVLRYEVQRGKTKTFTNKNKIMQEMKRQHLINLLLNGNSFIDISVDDLNNPFITKLYCGDDWYIGVNNENEIIEEFIVNYHGTSKATEEMTMIREVLQKKRGIK